MHDAVQDEGPVERPHAPAFELAAVQVRAVRLRVQPQDAAEGAQHDPHGREAVRVRVQGLCEEVQGEGQLERAPEETCKYICIYMSHIIFCSIGQGRGGEGQLEVYDVVLRRRGGSHTEQGV